jgi:hypothetical protein
LTIKEKYGTNLWTKLIMPIKDLTSFLEAGVGRFRIAAILSGSILIPELKNNMSKDLSLGNSKYRFRRI